MNADLLLIFTGKFKNKRIVRNIYEYSTGTRKYWLDKYRYCISNGYIINKCSHYCWPCRGVFTFQLAGDRFCRGKDHSKCIPGLHSNMDYISICWSIRIKEALERSWSSYVSSIRAGK